jgi:hypothetical protein
MTQLRPDAAYIRTESPAGGKHSKLSAFDEEVCKVLTSAHTVVSATKALASARASADLESKVTAAMIRLLEADRIELSPDS